ncbi:MAG TPA: sulfatase-like hydrolase/transferase [Phycisphaerae bacterium]|nr:sulfatase-like hydrolase/transferase [Phycisphaerae bacterium]
MTIIMRFALAAFVFTCCVSTVARADDTDTRPNIIYIMSDDHASHAMSCYGSKVNETPNLDRIAKEGVKFTNAFCTNSICSPCRAVVFTGKYSHLNGVLDNRDVFDGSQPTVPSILKAAGYQTAMIGKWHLHSDPIGFDYWKILPGQGKYHDPDFIEMGKQSTVKGYATDIIGDDTINWIRNRDPKKPFCIFSHHKAPHRNWQPDEKHKKMFEGKEFPLPETFDDDYKTRSLAATEQEMSIEHDLTKTDLKEAPPEGLTGEALKKWKYNRYMQDYLACIASVDDNVGKLLDFLDESGLADNTIVIYTSDQGFYLGDHGWFDKRFMYEESYRMPLIVRYPKEIKPASTVDDMVLNLDFAPTMLDFAGVKIPAEIQGRSFRPLVKGEAVGDWRKSTYYHYYEYPAWHMVKRHYGVRTDRYKLIHFYFDIDAWELYDLKNDPHELNNIYDDPANAELVKELKAELARLQKQYGDSPELAEKFLQEDLKDPKIRERVRKKIEERDERERKAAEAKESKANANP